MFFLTSAVSGTWYRCVHDVHTLNRQVEVEVEVERRSKQVETYFDIHMTCRS